MHCCNSAKPSLRKLISESPFGGRKSLIRDSKSLIGESKRIVCGSILNV